MKGKHQCIERKYNYNFRRGALMRCLCMCRRYPNILCASRTAAITVLVRYRARVDFVELRGLTAFVTALGEIFQSCEFGYAARGATKPFVLRIRFQFILTSIKRYIDIAKSNVLSLSALSRADSQETEIPTHIRSSRVFLKIRGACGARDVEYIFENHCETRITTQHFEALSGERRRKSACGNFDMVACLKKNTLSIISESKLPKIKLCTDRGQGDRGERRP